MGTEANAIQNMATNAKHFNYPEEGFITPIEHSLLYAMIEFPERYPESVVKSEIEDEEFDVYLYVNDKKRKQDSGGSENVGGYSGDASNRQIENEEVDAANQSSAQSNEERRVSYAQLSALLSLSSEKNPSRATPDEQPRRSSSNNESSANRSNSNNIGNINTNNTSAASDDKPKLSIGQTLCRKLLKTITRYSDANNLDRQTEISEFLNPIERRCQLRNEKAALQQLLPAYAGYTISLMTGNPLPLLIGAAALTGPDPMVEENSNVRGFQAKAGRVGDMETAGLLDECDSD